MKTKVCSHCKVEKELSQFYNSKVGRLGVTHQCKFCMREYRRTEKFLSKRRMRSREFRKNHKKEHLAIRARNYTKDYAKISARNYLNRQVIRGKFLSDKTQICLLKDDECRGKMEYHHYLGYDKKHRMDVIPLCVYHHRFVDFRSK